MCTRWGLTALSLGLALYSTSTHAQTHYRTEAPATRAPATEAPATRAPATEAPATLSAGAFATAVVFEGGEIFVGRPGEFMLFPIPANHAGTVHVFGLDDSGDWVETAVLGSASVEVGDGFGTSLAVDGNTLLVGAPMTRGGRGAVYVFSRAGAGAPWQAVTTLRSATRREGDEFGAAVAIDGEFALIGSPGRGQDTGAVLVFRLLGGAWTEVATVEGSGVSFERFGAALAIDEDRLLVGAPGPFPDPFGGDAAALRPGSAYVFDLIAGQFVQSARLTSGESGPGLFGHAIVLNGAEAFLGAPFGNESSGVVHHFTLSGSGVWTERPRIMAATLAPGSGYGMSVSLAAGDLLVGAPLGGGVYVLRGSDGGEWQEVQILTIGGPDSYMGLSVAASGNMVVVGSPGADFYEGIGSLYNKDVATGDWTEVTSLIDESSGMESILGTPTDCERGEAAGFDCSDIDLISFLPVQEMGGARGVMVNDIWGWTDPETGTEYALVGRMDGTAFVSLADPANPRYLGELPPTEGTTNNLWRDIKVYADHAFIVADGAGAHGVQIFDLTQLRDVRGAPVTFVETAHYSGIFSVHNIVINEATGFAYAVGSSGGGETCGGGLHMIDIHEPTSPTFAGCFSDPSTGRSGTGYSHDAQCVVYAGPDEQYRGREICFGANETALSIADVTDKSNPVSVASATYPNPSYVHQGWISEDHRFFFVNDELDEMDGTVTRTRTLVWDIEDLDDPILAKEHIGETESSDHNLYVRGQFMYQSNYVSGLRILDISDPANPREVGYFDSVPVGENSPGFAGSWSNYPFFESGVIVFTSMREGLFVVRRGRQPVL